jgi:hypothetical protein
MQFARPRALDPQRDQHAGEVNRGEHRGDHADQQDHGKPAHGARAEIGHDRCRDHVSHIGVENRPEGLGIAGLDGIDQPPAAPHFLSDALVDQHVGVDRGADRQDETRDSGQSQSGVEDRHDPEDQEGVHHQRDVRKHPEAAVGDEHENDNPDDRDD